MIKNFLKKNKKAGFTLVETLVAITILMISIAGPMVLVGNGINVSRFSRDQVIAFYLAQDAIESLRFIRDINRIDHVNADVDFDINGYLNRLTDCQGDDVFCDVDTASIYNNPTDIFNQNYIKKVDDDSFIVKDTVNSMTHGYYRPNFVSGSGSMERTRFQRLININPISENEIDITVTVTWDSGGIFGNRTFTVKESLFYWY